MLEKKKNTIIINREKVSSEEVRQQQNFGKILSSHQRITKRPIYQQKKFYFALFLIVLVGLLIYLSDKEEREAQPTTTESTR